MNRLVKYGILVLLFLPQPGFTQAKNEELMDWDSSRRLTWNDYKGTPDRSSNAAASTTTHLGIEYNISSTGFTYKIHSRFSKTSSWGLNKTEYILSHEQGHFDIAEVYARKLNKKMSEYKFDPSSYQKDLNKIYQEILDEKEKVQNEYDEETNHSIKKDKQTEWLKKISKMLEDLKAFAGY